MHFFQKFASLFYRKSTTENNKCKKSQSIFMIIAQTDDNSNTYVLLKNISINQHKCSKNNSELSTICVYYENTDSRCNQGDLNKLI